MEVNKTMKSLLLVTFYVMIVNKINLVGVLDKQQCLQNLLHKGRSDIISMAQDICVRRAAEVFSNNNQRWRWQDWGAGGLGLRGFALEFKRMERKEKVRPCRALNCLPSQGAFHFTPAAASSPHVCPSLPSVRSRAWWLSAQTLAIPPGSILKCIYL